MMIIFGYTIWEDVLLAGIILLFLGKVLKAPFLVGVGVLVAIGSAAIPYMWDGIVDFFNGIFDPLGVRNIF
jgi:threonine/homoserine efflux transporter RhtA